MNALTVHKAITALRERNRQELIGKIRPSYREPMSDEGNPEIVLKAEVRSCTPPTTLRVPIT